MGVMDRLGVQAEPANRGRSCFAFVQYGMKRQAVGIWQCKACKKTLAGGAYVCK